MKLSERLTEARLEGVGSAKLSNLLDEAAELARRVEGAAVGRVDMICAADAVVVDELPESTLYAINKQRVRLVPEAGQGGGE